MWIRRRNRRAILHWLRCRRGWPPVSEIHDTRSAAEIAAMLRAQHLDPVWKDWDEALLAGV